ncbi:hypothetical protein H5410_064843, partial [Solanum commersonii]
PIAPDIPFIPFHQDVSDFARSLSREWHEAMHCRSPGLPRRIKPGMEMGNDQYGFHHCGCRVSQTKMILFGRLRYASDSSEIFKKARVQKVIGMITYLSSVCLQMLIIPKIQMAQHKLFMEEKCRSPIDEKRMLQLEVDDWVYFESFTHERRYKVWQEGEDFISMSECMRDPSLILPIKNIRIKDNLSYEEIPRKLLGSQEIYEEEISISLRIRRSSGHVIVVVVSMVACWVFELMLHL